MPYNALHCIAHTSEVCPVGLDLCDDCFHFFPCRIYSEESHRIDDLIDSDLPTIVRVKHFKHLTSQCTKALLVYHRAMLSTYELYMPCSAHMRHLAMHLWPCAEHGMYEAAGDAPMCVDVVDIL